MTLKFTCFDLLFIIRLLLIKDNVCHALKLKRSPDGVTAIDASDQCGTAGLENDPLVLNQIPELNGKEFWTGLGIYTPLTSWIETVGCFLLRMPLSTVSVVPSVGLCQHECLKGYFTYNKADSTCSCLNITDKQLTNGTNLSACLVASAKTVLLYKTYTGAVMTFEAPDGLCTTLTCTPPYAVYLKAAPCKGVSTIKGVCEDGTQSTSHLWSLSYNQTRENCWNKNKLLLHSNACEHLEQDLTARAWTNIFREQIEVEQPLGDRTAVPKFCLSANITDKGENIFNVHRRNCLKKLKWFVCKNDSTKVGNTYHTYVATDSNYDLTSVKSNYRIDAEKHSNYGAIVGGFIVVVLVLMTGVTVFLCKIRRVGVFKNIDSTTSTNVAFTKSSGKNTSLEVHTQQHDNQGYGLAYQGTENGIKTNNAYAQVQKVKRVEDTYIASSNGEYDHLHTIDGRRPKAGENTYDSNERVRNLNDPTYDTATSSTGVDMDTTYDHSFPNMKTYSEYDVSGSGLHIDRTDHDVYDQAC
ncbi:uncharacterized protein LOC143053604 [Mytilus galloprovincialis]|uniref:uncharacterized protein LOC143053604 n=1 Tax=Mytilus galloprovincialis TaxID=29158 RepID=UPI003F7C45E4